MASTANPIDWSCCYKLKSQLVPRHGLEAMLIRTTVEAETMASCHHHVCLTVPKYCAFLTLSLAESKICRTSASDRRLVMLEASYCRSFCA